MPLQSLDFEEFTISMRPIQSIETEYCNIDDDEEEKEIEERVRHDFF